MSTSPETVTLVSVCITGLVSLVSVLATVWMKRGDRAHERAMRAHEEQLRYERAWWAKREKAYEKLQPLLMRISNLGIMAFRLHLSEHVDREQVREVEGEVDSVCDALNDVSIEHSSYMSGRINYLCSMLNLTMVQVRLNPMGIDPAETPLEKASGAIHDLIAEELRGGPAHAQGFDDSVDVRRRFPMPVLLLEEAAVGLRVAPPGDPPKPD